MGENGAGKSTLVKILTGVVAPDAGAVLVDGEPRSIGGPSAAHRLGIVAMYQEPTVFEDLTVAENVFAGRAPAPALRRGRLEGDAPRGEAASWPRSAPTSRRTRRCAA